MKKREERREKREERKREEKDKWLKERKRKREEEKEKERKKKYHFGECLKLYRLHKKKSLSFLSLSLSFLALSLSSHSEIFFLIELKMIALWHSVGVVNEGQRRERREGRRKKKEINKK